MLLCAAVVAAATTSSSAATTSGLAAFQTRWQPSLRMGAADATQTTTKNNTLPSHCSLAVVGAGWGGVYAAWRLAVDTKTIDASKVCVFEANGRVGGRVYSLHGLPGFADLAVDVGGYRFQQTQKLPADLVWNALKLATACYDWSCAPQCENTTCYVIKDAYGNNAGYATAIEAMLSQLENAGAGQQVRFASRLTKVDTARHVSPSASQLTFADGRSVTADTVMLNLPGNAIEGLDPTSILFRETSNRTATLLDSVWTFGMNKVYAWYDDAWWNSKLGLMEGHFDEKAAIAHPAPLEGRYHDGPQRCVIGKDTTGTPVYSGRKVKRGNCSGALEVYYGEAQPYYQGLMNDPLQPLTVITREPGGTGGEVDALQRKALDDVHAHLMAYHADQLKAAGVNPTVVPYAATPEDRATAGTMPSWPFLACCLLPTAATAALPRAMQAASASVPHMCLFLAPCCRTVLLRSKPKTLVISNWTPDGKYTPGIGSLSPPKGVAPDQARKVVRKPLSSHALYVINQDYGYQTGWAVGSLAMAEKVLQAELGVPRPAWLDEQWYTAQVVAKP